MRVSKPHGIHLLLGRQGEAKAESEGSGNLGKAVRRMGREVLGTNLSGVV